MTKIVQLLYCDILGFYLSVLPENRHISKSNTLPEFPALVYLSCSRMPPFLSIFSSSQALGEAAQILSAGAQSLLVAKQHTSSSHGHGVSSDDRYLHALVELRKRWKLKRGPKGIVVDISFASGKYILYVCSFKQPKQMSVYPRMCLMLMFYLSTYLFSRYFI